MTEDRGDDGRSFRRPRGSCWRRAVGHRAGKAGQMSRRCATMPATVIAERIGWDRVLFSTDYPHWDFDDPRSSFRAPLTDAQRQQLLFGNARKVYERLG